MEEKETALRAAIEKVQREADEKVAAADTAEAAWLAERQQLEQELANAKREVQAADESAQEWEKYAEQWKEKAESAQKWEKYAEQWQEKADHWKQKATTSEEAFSRYKEGVDANGQSHLSIREVQV